MCMVCTVVSLDRFASSLIICVSQDLLTSSGWISTYSVASILLQVGSPSCILFVEVPSLNLISRVALSLCSCVLIDSHGDVELGAETCTASSRWVIYQPLFRLFAALRSDAMNFCNRSLGPAVYRPRGRRGLQACGCYAWVGVRRFFLSSFQAGADWLFVR